MSKKEKLDSLQREYSRLSTSLASIGYISQGSVLDRSTLHPPRSGYQWTRKVAQKTITVALSPEQFHSLSKAIENRRKLATTLTKMEKLSRRILFGSLTDTRRRRPLNKNVLQTICKRHAKHLYIAGS
jgi:hypothetical protein